MTARFSCGSFDSQEDTSFVGVELAGPIIATQSRVVRSYTRARAVLASPLLSLTSNLSYMTTQRQTACTF